MDFYYSQAMIHALTCSYSLQQVESEKEQGLEVVAVEQHRQNDDSPFPKIHPNTCLNKKVQMPLVAKRFSSTSSCRNRPSPIHYGRRNVSTGSTPPTIEENLVMEDLVLESRDWLLNSLLDVEPSVSDE
jgi:hypothetical protein